MELYWNDTLLRPGMLIMVDERSYQVSTADGRRALVVWEILCLDTKTGEAAYYDPDTKRSYSMRRVMKSRSLLAKLEQGSIIQIPACKDFLVVREYHDGVQACKRCYSVDMLANINDFRIIDRL
jgi:hypothetical protein